jgi:hypothetical protein
VELPLRSAAGGLAADRLSLVLTRG